MPRAYAVASAIRLSPSGTPAAMQPSTALTRISSPVFLAYRVRSSSSEIAFVSAAMSSICPSIIPIAPSPSTRAARRASSGATAGFFIAVSTARSSSESPASSAVASPQTLWFVGLPRRRSSSSMQGRSSCISENVCIISTAQANGIAAASLPPKRRQNSSTR